MSGVRCQVSHVSCIFLFFSFFLGQSGGASRWWVCYQRGLPRLVLMTTTCSLPRQVSFDVGWSPPLHHYTPAHTHYPLHHYSTHYKLPSTPLHYTLHITLNTTTLVKLNTTLYTLHHTTVASSPCLGDLSFQAVYIEDAVSPHIP